MAQIARIDITKQNCWICDHFRRNNGSLNDPNTGSCTRFAPSASGAVASPGTDPPGATEQDTVGAEIPVPEETFCGDFKRWIGAARETIVVVE